MNEEEILKLLDLLVGRTGATGWHGTDLNERVPNVSKLGSITAELCSQLLRVATSLENRDEISAKKVGKEARKWIDFIELEILETKKD